MLSLEERLESMDLKEVSVKHRFMVRDSSGMNKEIVYVRGVTREGSDFEAYVPADQSGQVVGYVAGFGVLPSVIENNSDAINVFGDMHSVYTSKKVLDSVNEKGYYGNTQLRLALEGRSSVVVYEKGFTDRIKWWTPWKILTNTMKRLVTRETAKNQVKDTIHISHNLSDGKERVCLAPHSLATMEIARMWANLSDYNETGYSYVKDIGSFALHSVYTTPDDASRNAIPENLWRGDKDTDGKSKLWIPAFKALRWAYNKLEKVGLGKFTPGVYPLGSVKRYHLNPDFVGKNVKHRSLIPMFLRKLPSQDWKKGATVINGGNADYFLIGMEDSIQDIRRLDDHSYFETRDRLYVVTGKDGIFSRSGQFSTKYELEYSIPSSNFSHIELENHAHCPFVDYGEPGSVIMDQRRDYISELVKFTSPVMSKSASKRSNVVQLRPLGK